MSIIKKIQYELKLRKYKNEQSSLAEEIIGYEDTIMPYYGAKLKEAYDRYQYCTDMCDGIENLLQRKAYN